MKPAVRLVSLLLVLLLPLTALADTWYTLYIGTNDKDDHTPHMTQEEAMEQVEAVCARYIGGWTGSYATGAWTNGDGTLDHENTLVITITDATAEQVHGICDEVLTLLNQSSILIATQEVQTEFYSGQN